MAFKLFSTGLGIIDHPFATGGQVSIAHVRDTNIPGGDLKIVVDHSGQGQDSFAPTITPSFKSLVGKLTERATSSPVVSSRVAAEMPKSNVKFVPVVDPQTFSEESSEAPYDTLFHDFELEVIPHYNFWTDDETTNDRDAQGDRKIEDIPRYVRVMWTPAPDLPDLRKRNKEKLNRDIKPVLFSSQPERAVSINAKGLSFSLQHMQPSNFSLIKNSLANGYVSPGIMNSVVELPLQSPNLDSYFVHSQTELIHHIDEDAFLAHPSTEGISINELRANVHQMTNGMLGAAALDKSPVSSGMRASKRDVYDNNFAVSKSPSGGGELQVHTVGPTGTPALSIVGASAVSRQGDPIDRVVELISTVSQPPSTTDIKRFAAIKVRFVNASLGGALSEKKVNSLTQPHQSEATLAMAQSLPNLEVFSRFGFDEKARRTDIPSFASPVDLKPLEYVGYVLEKYKQNANGAFERVEEILLPSREYSEYIDTKVLYGSAYRYRIKSLLRWTRPSNVGAAGIEPFTISSHGSQTQELASQKSSYFGSEWSKNWGYGQLIDTTPPPPPDELTVRPESARKRIVISVKLPDNPQRDIFAIRIYRKIQDLYGNDLSNWEILSRDFGPQNVLFYDEDVDFAESNGLRYVYSTRCISRHWEMSVFSEQLAACLNRDYRIYGEHQVQFVSCAGVKSEHFGAFGVFPFRRTRPEIVFTCPPRTPENRDPSAHFSLRGREAIGNKLFDSNSYMLRIESLDTGEVRDLPAEITYNTQAELQDSIDVGAFIASNNVGLDQKGRISVAPASGRLFQAASSPVSPIDQRSFKRL